MGLLLSLVGKSGSGKSTLLYILSTLDEPTSGALQIDGSEVTHLSEKEVHHFRNVKMGFVFQFHYLLSELTALENVLMPAMKLKNVKDVKPFALDLLKTFGLADKAHRYPAQLSGGEQQRVAIARALSMRPKYIFADEPTGNLDSANGTIVMDIFKDINVKMGTTVIYVTHDIDFSKLAQRQIHLIDGKISF